MATVRLVFSNGVTSPPVNNNTFTPKFTSPAAGQPFVLAAVGDGAVGNDHSDQVSSMVQSWNPNLFMYLGDVYLNGSVGDFYNWYGHRGWGYGNHGWDHTHGWHNGHRNWNHHRDDHHSHFAHSERHADNARNCRDSRRNPSRPPRRLHTSFVA